MEQSNNSLNIGWYIDRIPDYTIGRDNYSSWISESINYQRGFNINRTINSPWINDPYYNVTPISRIRNNRYFNHINTLNDINYINPVNSNRAINILNNITEDEYFIRFETPRNHRINIDIINFTVSEEDRHCCICMEERQSEDICRLNCRHSFCVQCINQHLQTNHSCPICRSDVTNLSVQNNHIRDRINL
jgi:hypothetical protein